MQDPLKQGLKPERGGIIMNSFIKVEVQDPLKQGLKHSIDIETVNNEVLLKCKIH